MVESKIVHYKNGQDRRNIISFELPPYFYFLIVPNFFIIRVALNATTQLCKKSSDLIYVFRGPPQLIYAATIHILTTLFY